MISNRDQLINALANNTSRIVFDKASISSQTANSFASLWRATGQPTQGAVPTTADACGGDTAGCFQFTQQTDPSTSYIGYLNAICSNANTTLEIHDRLAHMGGLSGTSTSAQTVNLDLAALLSLDNLPARIGDANYSDVQWWLEWYTATGSTSSNATVNVTYSDGTTGNLTATALAGSRPAGHAIPLNPLMPAQATPKFIREVNTVQLSTSTGTTGNFGVTATRVRATMPQIIANVGSTYDWAQVGLPEIANYSCLFLMMFTAATTTGTVRGGGKIIHG